MKNIRRYKNAFLVVFLFLIFPFVSLAEDDLLLSSYDTNNILNRLPEVLTDQWIDSIVYSKSGKEQAATVILKQAAQQRTVNYLLLQAPKEVVKEIARSGYMVYSLISGQEAAAILGNIEDTSAKEAVSFLLKKMKEQKMKISFGDLKVEYETTNNEFITTNLQYIIIFKPITETEGEIVIKIYSASNLAPPKSKGDPWSAAINYTWFEDGEMNEKKTLPPFIVQIDGKINREKGSYWQKDMAHEYDFPLSPNFSITFPENVPTFTFPKEGWLGKLLNGAKEKLSTIAELFGANLVKEEDIISKEAEEEIKYNNIEEELAQKIAELEKKYSQNDKNSQTALSEIKQMKKEMTNLLKQFVNVKTKELLPEKEEVKEATTSEAKREDKEFNLVISEVCSGTDNSKAEFVEIYNPNDFAVRIDDENFQLWIVDSKDKPTQKRITWNRNNIPAKGYFLLAGSELFFSGLKFDADAYYSNQITGTGGVIISRPEKEDFDKLGWGKAGMPIPESGVEGEGKVVENGLESGISLVRKVLGSGYIDTDNNKDDFDVSSFPSPKNSLNQESVFHPRNQYSFPISSGSGSFTPSTSVTSYQKILISEIKNKGEGSNDDFIELFNPNSQDINLKSWQLKKKTSSGAEYSIIVFDDTHAIKSNQYFLWASNKDGYASDIQANSSSSGYLSDNNSVALFNPNKEISDALAWQESSNPFVEGSYFDSSHLLDQSIGRKSNSSTYIDSNNNATDFEIQIPTPGSPNQKIQSSNSSNDNQTTNSSLCQASGVVISEIKLAKTEYVELFNTTNSSISLSDCFLSYYSSSNDWSNPARTWQLKELTIPTRQHGLIGVYEDVLNTDIFDLIVKSASGNPYASQQLSQNGAIGLFSCNPSDKQDTITAKDCKIDAVGWNSALVKEEENTNESSEEKSMARIIDPDDIGQLGYKDTDNNNQDFEIQDPTPNSFSNHSFSDIDNDGLLDVKDINVTLGFNTFLDSGEYVFKNLVITNNSKLTLKSDCSQDLGVRLKVKNLTIDAGSFISADSQGCTSGQGKGSFGSGGGYGGRGGGDNSLENHDSYYDDGGLVYGDIILPNNLGSSGGGLGGIGGTNGGGAIAIEAEESILIDGILSANGTDMNAKTGGGSGGSIYLSANEISGLGKITANGGSTIAAGGGGGRIAIYYNSLGINDIQAYGGDQSDGQFDGAAGTIFLKNKTQERGELIIKNNNLQGLAETEVSENLMLKNLEIGLGSRLKFKSSLIDSQDLSIFSKGKLLFEDDVSIKSDDLIVSGEGMVFNISGKTTAIKGGNIIIQENGEIESNIIMLADNLNVYPGGSLNANKKGYSSNNGTGRGTLGSGGGYGGRGGGDDFDKDETVYAEKGISYGDFRLPNEYGSGGGSYASAGGYGGGLIKLEVKNITINGTLSSNGGEGVKTIYGYSGGGGAGGGIVMKTEDLSGTGEMLTNGASQEYSCTGGGGRIAIYYKSKDSFSGKINSYGGEKSDPNPIFKGEPGTIYLQQIDASDGELKFGD